MDLAGVALRKESVDRNCMILLFLLCSLVALRKESVDRNVHIHAFAVAKCVDRNIVLICAPSASIASLSARRAWIEIFVSPHIIYTSRSLSARRAWIEIIR